MKPLAWLPAYPGSCLFAAGLNLAVAPQLPGDVCSALSGKRIAIRVLDAGLQFDVCWNKGRFEPRRAGTTPDLAIGASARDFMLLAQRREDPDTLFFGRRLSMEGDTELGLLLKNTLDALDLQLLTPASWRRRPAFACRDLALLPTPRDNHL